jgi:glucose-1-phosphate cytidylyltransferase
VRAPDNLELAILAGGPGTRLAEETELKPKPIVEIGGRPILWHILKHYACYGHREFFIALAYKGDEIKRYFLDRARLRGDMTLRPVRGELQRCGGMIEDWTLQLIDTGTDTMTGGRVKRLEANLRGQTFMVTYGDGVADVDLHALLDFHKRYRCLATVTAVRPPARFGGLILDGDRVTKFSEKPQSGEGWINGGYLVFEPALFDEFLKEDCSLESDVLEN